MKKSKAPSSRRAEIQHLYQLYASGQMTLPACALLRFLHKEQMELTANEETAENLIDRYEIEETGEWRENFAPCETTCLPLIWGEKIALFLWTKAQSSNHANLVITEVKVQWCLADKVVCFKPRGRWLKRQRENARIRHFSGWVDQMLSSGLIYTTTKKGKQEEQQLKTHNSSVLWHKWWPPFFLFMV